MTDIKIIDLSTMEKIDKDKFDQQYVFEYGGNRFYIPRYMEGGIIRYIRDGIHPGDFLTAVICNDLSNAVGQADSNNIGNLPAYASYFYNEAPSPCWGSKEKMKAWIEMYNIEERESLEDLYAEKLLPNKFN